MAEKIVTRKPYLPSIQKTCLECAREFTIKASHANRTECCSRECSRRYRFHPRSVNGIDSKLCQRCRSFKPLAEFGKTAGHPPKYATGLRSVCVSCDLAAQASVLFRKCTGCNTTRPATDFHKAHRSSAGSASKCKRCARLRNKRDYFKHQARMLAKGKEWKANNKDKCLAHNRKTREKVRLQTIEAYGGRCACCGESEPKFLTIDHIFNDGATDRLTLFKNKRLGSTSMYLYLRRNGFPKDRYQLLCYNCNCAKGFSGQCPHQINSSEVSKVAPV